MSPESLFFLNVVGILGMLLTCLWMHALTADRINKLEKSRTVPAGASTQTPHPIGAVRDEPARASELSTAEIKWPA